MSGERYYWVNIDTMASQGPFDTAGEAKAKAIEAMKSAGGAEVLIDICRQVVIESGRITPDYKAHRSRSR